MEPPHVGCYGRGIRRRAPTAGAVGWGSRFRHVQSDKAVQVREHRKFSFSFFQLRTQSRRLLPAFLNRTSRIVTVCEWTEFSEYNLQSIPAVNPRESLARFQHREDSRQVRLHVLVTGCQLQQRHRVKELPFAVLKISFQIGRGACRDAAENPLRSQTCWQVTNNVPKTHQEQGLPLQRRSEPHRTRSIAPAGVEASGDVHRSFGASSRSDSRVRNSRRGATS